MPDELGPIEIECDAPPYAVVKACRRLGFRDPQDVRWCRARPLERTPDRTPDRPVCSCGQACPPLDRYSFTFASGRREDHCLTQCPRCRTIHWARG